MGLIDTKSYVCPIHARRFEPFKVCGVRIMACPSCTNPDRKRFKRRFGIPFNGDRRLGKTLERARRLGAAEAAQNTWAGKDTLMVSTGRTRLRWISKARWAGRADVSRLQSIEEV